MNAGQLVEQDTGQVFALGYEPLTIGRQADSDVVLADPLVSRQHAEIAMQGGRWVIRDLGSANGTFVNEEPISGPYVLKQGDTIRVGRARFQVKMPMAMAAQDTLVERMPVPPPPAARSRAWGWPLWLAVGLGLAALAAVALLIGVLVVWPRIQGEGEAARPADAPVVTILAPADGAQVQVGTVVEVRAEATSSRGVVQAQVLVDGVVVGLALSEVAQPSLPVSGAWTVERPGAHAISAVALDADGQPNAPLVIRVVAVEAAPPSPLPTETAAPTRPPPSPLPPTGAPTPAPTAVTDTPSPPPTIGYFRADPTTIEKGQCTRLAWGRIQGANRITLSDVGQVGASGKLDVCLEATQTYTLRATGAGGATEKRLQIEVQRTVRPVIAYFRVIPSIVPPGGCATLEWGKVDHATSAAIEPGIGGVGTPGSQQVCPGGTTTYVLTAQNPEGVTTAQATLVLSDQNAPRPVIPFFTADPSRIRTGECAMLRWGKVDYAVEVTVDQGIGGVATPGSREVCLGKTTTYLMTAVGPGGATERRLTVTVAAGQAANLPDLVIEAITFAPNPCYRGQGCKVEIKVRNDGPAAAGHFMVRWAPEGEEAVPVEWDVDSLGVGQTKALSYTWIPDRAAAEWRTVAVVDAADQVDEIEEGEGNTLAQTITVLEP